MKQEFYIDNDFSKISNRYSRVSKEKFYESLKRLNEEFDVIVEQNTNTEKYPIIKTTLSDCNFYAVSIPGFSKSEQTKDFENFGIKCNPKKNHREIGLEYLPDVRVIYYKKENLLRIKYNSKKDLSFVIESLGFNEL